MLSKPAILFIPLGSWNHILFHRAVSPTCVDSGDRGLLLSAADPCVKIVYVKAYTLWSPIEIAVGVSLRGRYSDRIVSLRGRYSDHRGCRGCIVARYELPLCQTPGSSRPGSFSVGLS
jgi:hypothetical protein